MASYMEPNIYSFLAEGDLSTKQYHFVKAGAGANGIVIASANTDDVKGILMNAPTGSGQAAEVASFAGGAKLKIAEAIAVGDQLVSDANGQGVKANALGDFVGAVAQQTGVSGDIISVVVTQHKAVAAE